MAAHAESAHLLISQIKIAGETSTDEFVEIFNPTEAAVSIADWKLVKKTSSGSQSNLVSGFAAGTVLGPHKYFLITHKTGYLGGVTADTTYSGLSYSVAANNTVSLLDNNGAIIDKIGFGEAGDFEGAPTLNPEAGQSLKRKGWENSLPEDTNNNQADFTVGASSPRNSSYGGVYTPPAQEQSSTTTPPSLSIPRPLGTEVPRGGDSVGVNFETGQLLINEVYPVADTGEKEWIELYNPGSATVSLDGWTMEDARDLIASLYGTISKYSTWEITPSRLNNDGDTVKLKSPNGQIIDIISYGKMSSSTSAWPAGRPTPKAGESLARKIDGFNSGSANDFVITQTPTMGEANIVTAAAEEEEDMSSPYDSQSEQAQDAKAGRGPNEPAASGAPAAAPKKTSTTKKISGNTSATGVVIVPPGLFATQYFYIQKDGGGGVQIYSFKAADIPKLKVGDHIYVYGVASVYLGEPRIKTKLGGIKISGQGDLPEPLLLGIDELDEEMSGTLVKISGEITEKKSAGMYLDDGAGEIYINIKKKAGISAQDILPGNEAEITGVLIYNDKGFSILPRFGEDIRKLAGEALTAPKDASLLVNILKYTLPTLAAIGLGVAAYFWRMKKRLIFEGSEIVEQDNADKS